MDTDVFRSSDQCSSAFICGFNRCRDAEAWRIHFHVPVNAESLGPLRTTRRELKQALQRVARLDYAPHLEVETYTWAVLPGAEKVELVDGLTRELKAAKAMIEESK